MNPVQEIENLLGITLEDKLRGRYFSYRQEIYRIKGFSLGKSAENDALAVEVSYGDKTRYIYKKHWLGIMMEILAPPHTLELLQKWYMEV